MEYVPLCKAILEVIEAKRFQNLKHLRSEDPLVAEKAEHKLAILDDLQFNVMDKCGISYKRE